MKRRICVLLCLLLSFSLFGCQKEEKVPIAVPVEFFYLQSTFSYKDSDTVIGSELWESAGHEEDIVYLLNLYFSGPQSNTLTRPFPNGCSVVSCTPKNDAVSLVVSDKFATLTGMELTASCVCLAKTLSGLTGFDTVIIQARTQLLDGKKSITIRNGSPVLLDDYIAPTQSE